MLKKIFPLFRKKMNGISNTVNLLNAIFKSYHRWNSPHLLLLSLFCQLNLVFPLMSQLVRGNRLHTWRHAKLDCANWKQRKHHFKEKTPQQTFLIRLHPPQWARILLANSRRRCPLPPQLHLRLLPNPSIHNQIAQRHRHRCHDYLLRWPCLLCPGLHFSFPHRTKVDWSCRRI